jgi:antitoxin (DNA-binding transcriptional repressor) of toxin-antitoxin stability system
MREKGAASMTTVTVQETQSRLSDLIHQLAPGEEVVITENDRQVAKLVATPGESPPRLPGRCNGMLTVIGEDDKHLEHFKEALVRDRSPAPLLMAMGKG